MQILQQLLLGHSQGTAISHGNIFIPLQKETSPTMLAQITANRRTIEIHTFEMGEPKPFTHTNIVAKLLNLYEAGGRSPAITRRKSAQK